MRCGPITKRPGSPLKLTGMHYDGLSCPLLAYTLTGKNAERRDSHRSGSELVGLCGREKSCFLAHTLTREEIIMALTERRAEFVYNGARIAAIASKAPIVPVPWSEREKEFKDQFLKVIERQCGEQRSGSPEELHGSWMQAYFAMGWVYGEKYDRENKIHPDLVPYVDLNQLEQDKDAVFVALCEIARKWIYDNH